MSDEHWWRLWSKVLDDPRLTGVDKNVLSAIASYDWGDGCMARNESICARASCKARAAQKALAKLKQLGYIREDAGRAGKTRLFHVTQRARPPHKS